MVNFNGTIISQTIANGGQNRAFLYGDGVFWKRLWQMVKFFSRITISD
jgi:hypothetical protein